MTARTIAPQATRRELLRAMFAVGAAGAIAPLVGPHPAFAQTATPAAEGVQTETLLAMTLPAELVTLDEIAFMQFTEKPGVTEEYPTYQPARWVHLRALRSGPCLVKHGSPRAILRKGGSGAFELIPPETEEPFNIGDQDVIYDGAAAGVSHHPSPDPTVIIQVTFFAAAPPPAESGQIDAAGVSFEGLYDFYPDSVSGTREALTGKPLTVRIERLTVAPGAALPPSDEAYPMLRFVEAGKATWKILTDGADATPTPPALKYQGSAIVWHPMAPNRRLSLSNRESEPLVLLVASLQPADSASTIPAVPLPPAASNATPTT